MLPPRPQQPYVTTEAAYQARLALAVGPVTEEPCQCGADPDLIGPCPACGGSGLVPITHSDDFSEDFALDEEF